jgi:hypothetical protein
MKNERYYGEYYYDVIDAMELFGIDDREVEEARELRRRELEELEE